MLVLADIMAEKWRSKCDRHGLKWTYVTFSDDMYKFVCSKYIFNKLCYKRFGLVPINGTQFCGGFYQQDHLTFPS